MRRQRKVLLFIALTAAVVTTPALGQTATSGGGPAGGVTNGATAIPDFTRVWMHPAFPWFEPPRSHQADGKMPKGLLVTSGGAE